MERKNKKLEKTIDTLQAKISNLRAEIGGLKKKLKKQPIDINEMIAKLPYGEYKILQKGIQYRKWGIRTKTHNFYCSTLTEAVQKYFNHLQSNKA